MELLAYILDELNAKVFTYLRLDIARAQPFGEYGRTNLTQCFPNMRTGIHGDDDLVYGVQRLEDANPFLNGQTRDNLSLAIGIENDDEFVTEETSAFQIFHVTYMERVEIPRGTDDSKVTTHLV